MLINRLFTYLVLLFITATLSCAPPPVPLQGKVIRIQDGDTFDLLMTGNKTTRVRLYGIDCPEKQQPFSSVARTALAELIFDKAITAVRKDTDRYGRTVAIIYIHDTCVNEELLKRGLAWHYKHHDKNPAWANLENEAKRKQLGLWSQSHATPPWEFRRSKSNAVQLPK